MPPQSLSNHTRYDPAFHFFLAPVLLLNFILSIVLCIQQWPIDRMLHLWLIVLSVALLVLAALGRGYALKVQDRVIRMEERMRLAALLPPADLARTEILTIRQLVALRFASDAELPALVQKTLTQGLDPKAIKQNISSWRADNYRV